MSSAAAIIQRSPIIHKIELGAMAKGMVTFKFDRGRVIVKNVCGKTTSSVELIELAMVISDLLRNQLFFPVNIASQVRYSFHVPAARETQLCKMTLVEFSSIVAVSHGDGFHCKPM